MSIAAGVMLALVGIAALIAPPWGAERALLARIEQRMPSPAQGGQACPPPGAGRAVFLVLGQSNAGNHGAEEQAGPAASQQTVRVFDGHRCVRTGDPLPGGTGRQRSIWTRLPSSLRAQGYELEPVFVLLAVDSTTISDWTRPSSPLRDALQTLLTASAAAGLRPDLVLWQHGESDARAGTSADDYRQRLRALAADLRAAGVDAPIVAALSTRCGEQGPSSPIRTAITKLAAERGDIRLGPDTDAIGASVRNANCHFTAAGLERAAELWARTLAPLLRDGRGGHAARQ